MELLSNDLVFVRIVSDRGSGGNASLALARPIVACALAAEGWNLDHLPRTLRTTWEPEFGLSDS